MAISSMLISRLSSGSRSTVAWARSRRKKSSVSHPGGLAMRSAWISTVGRNVGSRVIDPSIATVRPNAPVAAASISDRKTSRLKLTPRTTTTAAAAMGMPNRATMAIPSQRSVRTFDRPSLPSSTIVPSRPFSPADTGDSTCREVVYSGFAERWQTPMNAARFVYSPARLGFNSSNTFLKRSM